MRTHQGATGGEGGFGVVVPGRGLVSGALMEFVAGVSFWLYSRGAKQFGAFHICLERTHRYLLAYKIAEKIEKNRDQTLEKIVCIMANAPMISQADIDGLDSGKVVPHSQPKIGSDPTITAVTVSPAS